MTPKPPSWFAKKLKAIDATLGVRHAGPQGWQIFQMHKNLVRHGRWNGSTLYEVKSVPEHVGYYSALGSAVLMEMPRFNSARYNGFDDFCKSLNIPY